MIDALDVAFIASLVTLFLAALIAADRVATKTRELEARRRNRMAYDAQRGIKPSLYGIPR